MTGIFDAVGVALILVFLCYMLKSVGFGGAKLVSTVGIVALIYIAGIGIGELMETVSDKFQSGGVSEIFISASKITGIGYVFGICSDICRDMGENGIANGVLVVGRVEILLVSLPWLEKILDVALELMSL